MVDDVLSELQTEVDSLTLIPSSGGRFEWAVNGHVVYSKRATGRYPQPDELKRAIAAKLN